MASILLKNARICDGVSGDCPQGTQLLVESGLIREVSDRCPCRIDVDRVSLQSAERMTELRAGVYMAGDLFQVAMGSHRSTVVGPSPDMGYGLVVDVLGRPIADGLTI